MNPLPFSSLIMPVFNEERFIAHSLSAALAQDYPADRLELIVADGGSTDRTREIVESFRARHSNLRLIDNPQRIVSTGLNRAMACARGSIIIRLDGHCEYPRDYVRQLVALREATGADNAGGILVPQGNGNYTSQAVAAACYSPVGIGSAMRGHAVATKVCEVDTVHGGCWRREQLLGLGGFDEDMVRNQDDELSFRLRKAHGRIVRSSAIAVKYWVRDRYGRLFLLFAQFGYWKVRVVQKHPQQSSLRHFIPSLFLLAVLAGAVAAPFTAIGRWLGLGLVSAYALAIALAALVEARRTRWQLWPGIALALPTMHLGYGGGFLLGWPRWLAGPLPTDRIFERSSR